VRARSYWGPQVVLERRISETEHRPRSITASIAPLLLSDVAAYQEGAQHPDPAGQTQPARPRHDHAALAPHPRAHRSPPPEGTTRAAHTVRVMTPAECAEQALDWPHTGVQVINGLTTKAQRGHLTPAEHWALSTATRYRWGPVIGLGRQRDTGATATRTAQYWRGGEAASGTAAGCVGPW